MIHITEEYKGVLKHLVANQLKEKNEFELYHSHLDLNCHISHIIFHQKLTAGNNFLQMPHTKTKCCTVFLHCGHCKASCSRFRQLFVTPHTFSLHQQLRCQRLARETTCLVLQQTACTAPCLNPNLSSSSSRLPLKAAGCNQVLSTALDQSRTLLRAAPFSHTLLLLLHHKAPPWASAATAVPSVWVWALPLEALALLVSG